MINKKLTKNFLLITMVLALVSFTGCKKSSITNYETDGIISEEVVDYDSQTDKIYDGDTEDQANEAKSDNSENQADEITIYGEVTAISNNEITLSLGTLNTPPHKDKKIEDNKNEDNEMTDAVSSSTDKVNKPTDDKSRITKDSSTNRLTLNGDEKIVTITDESIITLQESDSSLTGLEAIEVGNTLKIVYTLDSVNNETLTMLEIL